MRENIKKTSKRNCGKGGFSLVELVVAVAILAIMSTILIHAFVTSSNVTAKARRIGEATDIAQNVQEVVESMTVGDFLNAKTENFQPYFGSDVTTVDSVLNSNYDANGNLTETINKKTISDIKYGKSVFDVDVEFSTGAAAYVEKANEYVIDLSESDGFTQINKKLMTNYTVPDGSWIQPSKIYENPDCIADENFKTLVSNYDKIVSKTRTITFEITGKDEDGNVVTRGTDGNYSSTAKKVYVSSKWSYDYIYTLATELSGDNILKDGNDKEIKTITTNYQIISGTEVKDVGDFVTVYVLYYPCYGDATVRDTMTVFDDNIVIENRSDMNVRIILVKQKPLIYNETTGDYTEMEDAQLAIYENLYRFYVNEYHSNYYIKNYNRATAPLTFLTNATVKINDNAFSGESIATVVYQQRCDDTGSDQAQRKTNENIKDGSLVGKQSNDRFYDVTITVRQKKNDEVIYTSSFKASKLK